MSIERAARAINELTLSLKAIDGAAPVAIIVDRKTHRMLRYHAYNLKGFTPCADGYPETLGGVRIVEEGSQI